MTALASRIAECAGNIDRIVRLAKYPVTAIELEVSGADPDLLRQELARVAVAEQIDVAVQRAGLSRRAKRLVVMDVDSTLIEGEVIEELAARAGCLDKVAEITQRAMRGELDFAGSLIERVALLEGLELAALEDVRKSVRLMPGARTLVRTLKRLGYRIAIVSGGFTYVTDKLRDELGLDFALANTLEIGQDGRLTGRVVGQIVDRAGKAAALRAFAEAAERADQRHGRDRRRRQRPGHAGRRRARRGVQRQAGGPGAGGHVGERAVPGHDPLPAGDHAGRGRGGFGGRRRGSGVELWLNHLGPIGLIVAVLPGARSPGNRFSTRYSARCSGQLLSPAARPHR